VHEVSLSGKNSREEFYSLKTTAGTAHVSTLKKENAEAGEDAGFRAHNHRRYFKE
jgi:hypothetical protein